MNEATQKLTAGEIVESLTGYEEDEIEKRFGADVNVLLATKPMRALRALIFTVLARTGEKTAYKDAMSMPAKDVSPWFAEDEDEPMPEEPITESGKEASGAA